MREYELMYIVRPDVDDAGLQAAVDSVKSLIETNSGEVLRTTVWGKRRLAYEVKKLRDGYYVIIRANLETDKVAPVEQALRIHDSVFRHLLVTTDNIAELPESEISTAVVADVAEDDDDDDDEEEDDVIEAEVEDLDVVAVGADEEEA